MDIPNNFWRLAYDCEKDKDEMIRLSSIITPIPLQSDTLESIRKKIANKIRIGDGIILANFDDHTKNGKVTGIGIVIAKHIGLPKVQWKKIKSELFANSSSAIGNWRHKALFDFSDKRAKELRLFTLFKKHFNQNSKIKRHENISTLKEIDITENIFEITNDSSLHETEKRLLISARVGQGYFREELIKYWKGCPVSGVLNPTLLRASHIKPWSISTNQERLNPFNGLLLTPNIDLLFDRGFISFDSQGKVNISDFLTNHEAKIMGLEENTQITLEPEHQIFMEFHRNQVFRL